MKVILFFETFSPQIRIIKHKTTTMEKLTMEQVQVRILDKKGLEKSISEHIKQEICIRGFEGFIESPKMGFVDKEICAIEKDKDNMFRVTLHEPTKTNEDGSRSVSIFPIGTIGLDYEDIKPFFGETVSLAEFCKERRGYNPRLKNNEREIMNWINE